MNMTRAAGDHALPDHIVFALNPEHVEGYLPAIASIRASQPFSELLVVLDPYNDCHACMAFRAGATDVLHIDALQRAFVRQSTRPPSNLEDICKSDGMPAMERWIGNSAHARHIRTWLPRVAATDCNVLITGETGSGKELIAELLHASSRRLNARLISINCAAIPDSLLESELFGHERGAFTGDFHIVFDPATNQDVVIDADPLGGELPVYKPTAKGLGTGQSYAIIGFVQNLNRSGGVLLPEGADAEGTLAAADLVANESSLDQLRRRCNLPGSGNNHFSALIRVGTMAEAPTSVEVIACHIAKS